MQEARRSVPLHVASATAQASDPKSAHAGIIRLRGRNSNRCWHRDASRCGCRWTFRGRRRCGCASPGPSVRPMRLDHQRQGGNMGIFGRSSRNERRSPPSPLWRSPRACWPSERPHDLRLRRRRATTSPSVTPMAYGAQPDQDECRAPPSGFDTGYVDVFAARLRSHRAEDPGRQLQLPRRVDEDVRQRRLLRARRREGLHDPFKGAQLEAALAFLRAHPGQVSPITLTLWGNDVVEVAGRLQGRLRLHPDPCSTRLRPAGCPPGDDRRAVAGSGAERGDHRHRSLELQRRRSPPDRPAVPLGRHGRSHGRPPPARRTSQSCFRCSTRREVSRARRLASAP